LAITRRAMEQARREGFDVLILDTAGRLAINEELMTEVADISDLARPKETLLVADAMTGQDAVNVAKAFNERLAVTGIVLTRVDGDARGGAALSMRAVTGRPVKLIGVGEKYDALEPFHPDRIASRILGMGDIVSLVERAAETIEKEDAEKLAAKVRKGQFDMDDLLGQLRQLRKMGGLQGLLGMLPGAMQAKAAMSKAKIDEKQLRRQEAIILSMTPRERRNPDLIHASRKKRIAKGSGVQVQDVNKLLKQHADMVKMMKRVNKLGEKGFMRSLGGMTPPPGFPRGSFEGDRMLAIRMSGHGAKKRPFFHIVVADSRSPRDGRFIEKLGTYNPLLPREHAQRVTLDKERIAHWLKVGAQPSDRVAKFLAAAELMKPLERREQSKKPLPRAKAQERMKAAAAASDGGEQKEAAAS